MAKDWGWWGIAGVGMQSPSIVVVVLFNLILLGVVCLFGWLVGSLLILFYFFSLLFVLVSWISQLLV